MIPPLSESTRCSLFSEMNLAEREELLTLMEPRKFAAGADVLVEGDAQRTLWIITRGRCEVLKATKGGKHQQLAVLEQGAVFGEMSFFSAGEHSATVRALTDTDTMCLSRKQFDELLASKSSLVSKIFSATNRLLSERLRRMDDWTADLVERTAPAHREEWREFRSKLYGDLVF